MAQQKKTTAKKTAPALVKASFSIEGYDRGAVALVARPEAPLIITIWPLSDPSKRISASLGEKVSLAPGAYRISASFSPIEEKQIQCGKVYSQPTFSINKAVQIEPGRTDYPLAAFFDCFAITTDPGQRIRVRGYDGRMTDLPTFAKAPGRRVAFLRGRWEFPALELELTAEDGSVQTALAVTREEFSRFGEAVAAAGRAYSLAADGLKDIGAINE